ncbi:MAG: DUF1015 domain-containing protein [Bacteroidota bacterium]
MASILPFRGIRPAADKVHLVASRSVDNYSRGDLNEKLRGNPYTFLHVINPDFSDGERTKPGSPERLQKVKSTWEKFYAEGVFEQDNKPAYYVYRQFKQGNTYTGIIAKTGIDDYFNGVIKIHEQTLTERENKLKEYLSVCDFNAEPVLFCYPDDTEINTMMMLATERRADYDFTTTDRVRHTLWIVDQPEQVERLQERFAGIPAVYIADGHHRSASSALLGKERRDLAGNYTGKEPWNFYLGVFFPESQLRIYDFNRVVKDLNGLSEKEFLKQLETDFEIRQAGATIVQPENKHVFSMYLDGVWYLLHLREGRASDSEPVESLDAYLLSKYILDPILGIKDLKTDKRAGFVSGIKGPEELKNQVDNWKFKVAFGLYPVAMQELKRIADTGNIMPPKTTWVEPKMRSGLVIYSLSQHE